MKARALLALPLDQAVRRLALVQLDAAAKAYTRVTDRDDAEALHDFRVALRRLRSLLRAYAPWYDPVPKNLRKRLRRLARATNAARDAEVQIEWLRRTPRRLKAGAQFGLAWLLARLAERQRTAHRAVRKVVRKEFAVLEPRLRAALQARKHGHDDVACADATFAQATDERLSSYCAELAADLAGIGSVSDRDEIHAARISGKRLRYLIEPLRGIIPGAVAQVNSMKAFQDRLGVLHDRFVMVDEIEQAFGNDAALVEQVVSGLRELSAQLRRDVQRRYRDIRARYLGRHARSLLAPVHALNKGLVAANNSKPSRVRLK